MMKPSTTPLFKLGKVVATPDALAEMGVADIDPSSLLHRHVHGDWGDVDKDDWQANERALKDGSRIFSSYKLKRNGIETGTKIWVITEATYEGERRSTCLLLPSDY